MIRVLSQYSAVVMAAPLSAQDWHREDVRFEDIEKKARELSSSPFVAADKEALPAWMKNLTYDQYRDIRFKPESTLWAEGNLPFRAMFFHPGYLFREPVQINEYTDTHEQNIRLAEAFFSYGSLVGERGPVPAEGGFAGFKLLAPLNKPEVFDEMVVFQGASYWRALGKDQRYGISARGIAIDTGAEGGAEEFPSFREFWLSKPKEGDDMVRFHGLLDGPSCSGAYSFSIKPGKDTVVSVKAVVFPRRKVSRFAIAPMSSMFWFGENSRRRFDDFRPEVHDSDGLSISMESGEKVWRPLMNDSGRLEFSFFRMEKCEGFGLLQRDRRFGAYEDDEAAYHLRPSLWIEPTSDWGAGSVVLMEIPTGNELADNSVAFWEPAESPEAGDRIAFSYRQHWTMEADPSGAGGHVVATRTGVHEWQPEQRTIAVEFTGGKLNGLKDKIPEAIVEAIGENAELVNIQGVAVQALPEKRWRAAFQIVPAAKGGKLADIGPVELRCALRNGDDFLTETWAYRIDP